MLVRLEIDELDDVDLKVTYLELRFGMEVEVVEVDVMVELPLVDEVNDEVVVLLEAMLQHTEVDDEVVDVIADEVVLRDEAVVNEYSLLDTQVIVHTTFLEELNTNVTDTVSIALLLTEV